MHKELQGKRFEGKHIVIAEKIINQAKINLLNDRNDYLLHPSLGYANSSNQEFSTPPQSNELYDKQTENVETSTVHVDKESCEQ